MSSGWWFYENEKKLLINIIYTITIRLILKFISVVIFKELLQYIFSTTHKFPFYHNVIGHLNEEAQHVLVSSVRNFDTRRLNVDTYRKTVKGI